MQKIENISNTGLNFPTFYKVKKIVNKTIQILNIRNYFWRVMEL